MPRLVYIIIFLSCSSIKTLVAQNTELTSSQKTVDSLLNIYLKQKSGVTKIKTAILLSEWNLALSKNDTALKYSHQAIKLSQKLKFNKGVADGYNSLGNIYNYKATYDTALSFYLKALNIRETINDKKGVCSSLSNIGSVYKRQNQKEKALNYYGQALKIANELKDERLTTVILVNIGTIHRRNKEYEKALENYLSCLKIYTQKKAIERGELSFDDQKAFSAIYNNIGNVYSELKQIDTALKYQRMALSINEKLNDPKGIAICYNNIAQSYSLKNEFKLSLEFAKKSISISRNLDMKDLLRETYQQMASTYYKAGDFKLAYDYFECSSNIKDTILNEQNSRQINEMQTIYETEKKEQKIALLNKEKEKEKAISLADNKRKNFIIGSIAVGFCLVIVFALFILRSLKLTRKQKLIIEIKSKETELQKEIIEEKQKEVMDSIRYAKRIQVALLPSNKNITSILKRLKK